MLLEYFVAEDEENIDQLCKNGVTALFTAADYASPEAVSILIEWGTDPYLQMNVRPVQSMVRPQGLARLGRIATPSLFTPYEFIMFQLLGDHLFGASRKSRDFHVINNALPTPKSSADEHLMRVSRQFNTLAALSAEGGSVSGTPIASLIRDDATVPDDIVIKSLVPHTKRRWAQLVEREGGTQQYLAIWGFAIFGEYRTSVQIIPTEALQAKEIGTQTQYYKKIAKAQKHSTFTYTHGVADRYLHQFLVEYRPGGWEEVKDWISPGETLTWSKMIAELRDDGAPNDQVCRSDEVDSREGSHQNRTQGSGTGRALWELEESNEQVAQRLESLMIELKEAPDSEDE